MKKFLFALIAAFACMTTTFTLASCGDDDNDNGNEAISAYTVSFDMNKGTMPATFTKADSVSYDSVCTVLSTYLSSMKKTVNCSKSLAMATFEKGTAAVNDSLTKCVAGVKQAGVKGFAINCYLTCGKDTVEQKSWK